MLFDKKLLVFPTHRAIRTYLSQQSSENKLLPIILTIDEFLKKVINLEHKIYCEEEQRLLFLRQALHDIDIKKLGISKDFTKFLKQSDYIYRFFLEISSEKISIDDIELFDTYEYYEEHLKILKNIKENYEKILDEKGFVDRVNLSKNYKINKVFLKELSSIEIFFEGYFTKVEFDIIKECSDYTNIKINFHLNNFNQKSIDIFQEYYDEKFKKNHTYKIDLSNKKVLEVQKTSINTKNVVIKSFSSRINQVAFIKDCITKAVNDGINPSNIAVVLPDESFASLMQLFDSEKYFNYAMGKSIKNHKLYAVAHNIYLYLSDSLETKHIKALEYYSIDKKLIDETIKLLWNRQCTLEIFEMIVNFIKGFEENKELKEKYDELIYKLNILLFSKQNQILVKDVYSIFLQKIATLSLDDINSGKVTVLGLLETRSVGFDCVIICDFNEEYIPKKSLKDKFLSTKIKQAVGLPTSLDREALQKYYYKRLCDSSKNLFISYVANDTKQISRFANELFADKLKQSNTQDDLYKHILYNNKTIKYLNEEIKDKIDLSKFTWSASSLKVFLQCKKKFYLQYILKLKEHDISLSPKGYELGGIIHKILEEYYTQDIRTYKKLQEIFYKYKSTNSFLILELEVWKKKLKDFYDLDSKRLEDRKILKLEESFNIIFDDIKLIGTIDRIDFFDDTYEVIDYKTSNNLKINTARTYEKAVDFQLEFYFLAIQELYKSDKVECFYYDLNSMSLKKEEMLDKKLELLSQKFKEIKEISKDEIVFEKCEEKTTCQYCPYKIICDEE